MASKKDKGKGKIDSNALVLKPKSTPPVTSSPISAVDLVNRFSPFNPDLPVSYSSTLISPYDPFVDFPQKFKVPFTEHKKPSAYMVLPYFQHLFTIEMNRASIKSPNELAQSYFPHNFHWIPEHPKKNLTYYTNILKQTKSLHFKPIYCQSSPTKKIIFHNAYIDRVLSEKDWSDHPSSSKILPDCNAPYNYYDYIDAWSRFFLYKLPILTILGLLPLTEIILGKFFDFKIFLLKIFQDFPKILTKIFKILDYFEDLNADIFGRQRFKNFQKLLFTITIHDYCS
jgi:hypothetical protein